MLCYSGKGPLIILSGTIMSKSLSHSMHEIVCLTKESSSQQFERPRQVLHG